MLEPDLAELCQKLYKFIRCAVCDAGVGTRLRYSCGHAVCVECANSSDCPVCFENSPLEPIVDEVLTARVQNTANLLAAYKNLSGVDVFEKRRLSEKLKVERQIFPKCIQASSKYYNKRKSLNISFGDKENQLHFLGEHIQMDNKNDLIKKWLTDSENIQRKPFGDLNTNQPRLFDKKKSLIANKPTVSKKTKSKQSNVTLKRKKKDLNLDKIPLCLHNTETVVIEDSQDIVTIDKDREAWLKVLQAENKENQDENEDDVETNADVFKEKVLKNVPVSDISIPESENPYKVPFYKKTFLKDPCKLCDETIINDLNSTAANDDVIIKVSNKSFETTIKVTKKYLINKSINKTSTEVQTDSIQPTAAVNGDIVSDSENLCPKTNHTLQVNIDENKKLEFMSDDLFSENKILTLKPCNVVKNVSEREATKRKHSFHGSDSDDSDQWKHMEVKADIHKSYDENDYGALSEVIDMSEHAAKARRPARGLTPDSSNSSEKENYHPNKPKRAKRDKKYKK